MRGAQQGRCLGSPSGCKLRPFGEVHGAQVLIHANAYQSTLLAVGLASHPYTFGHMATMQKGFAACQSLFHVCQRHPILEKQVRSLLKENIGPISKTKHGQALLHTLAPDLGAHRFYKSWPSENQQYQQQYQQQQSPQQYYQQNCHQQSNKQKKQQQTVPPHRQQRFRGGRNQRYQR